MKKDNNTNPQQKNVHRSGPFQRTFTNKVIKLRQNYIIARDKDENKMKRDVQQLLSSPKFNRFISLSKCNIQDHQKYIAQFKVQDEKQRKPLESNFNRRQIYLMRQRRPDHNSPLKTRAQDILTRQFNKIQPKVHERPLLIKKQIQKIQDQQENKLLIKQMVTHIQEKKKIKKPSEDPYTPRCANNYYLAEVIKNYMNMQSLARDHIDNSLYFLQIFGKYNQPQNQPSIDPLNLRQKDKYKDKITVVFDLDETLVHCFQDRTQPHQLELPIPFSGGKIIQAPLNIRPGTKQLLEELSDEFQIMIFTASHQSYADAVINYLDPQRKYVQHRLYRRNCQCIQEGYYIKDLRVLGRDLSRTVLVDNAAYSYSFQIANGIPILPYYQGSDDYELAALKDYLWSLKGDVRQINKRVFRLEQYSRFNTIEQLVSELYI